MDYSYSLDVSMYYVGVMENIKPGQDGSNRKCQALFISQTNGSLLLSEVSHGRFREAVSLIKHVKQLATLTELEQEESVLIHLVEPIKRALQRRGGER